MNRILTKQPLCVVAIIKGDEKFIFTFDDASWLQAVRVVRGYAKDPELNFDDQDANQVIGKIRELVLKS